MTLVTAKKQHRCWKARTRTHTYEKTIYNYFARLAYQFLHIYKIICQFFVVFSLFGAISPHIHIGGYRNSKKNSLLLSNSTEGKCLKRDSNSYSRNGQGILSPSCLPFHHSGVRWCKGKYFEKSGQMFWLVLHHKCIRISRINGRISKKWHVGLTIRFCDTHHSSIVEVIVSLTTTAF